MALVTAAEARAHLPLLDGTGEDTLIGTLIDRAGRVLARWCGYPPATVGANPTLESATYVTYLDGPARSDEPEAIRLPVLPVVSVTSIYDDPSRQYTSESSVDVVNYIVYGEEGLVVCSTTGTKSGWSSDRRAIKVTYVAGFSTVPDDLKLAACLYVRHLWDLRHVQGRTSVAQGQANAGLRDETIPDSVKELLQPYRLASVYL